MGCGSCEARPDNQIWFDAGIGSIRRERPRCRSLDGVTLLKPWLCHAAGPSHAKDHSMASGAVKWFNATKGYGFIQPDDGSPDVFVHISAVERSGLSGLNDGQKVSYELTTDRKSGKTSASDLRTI
jgi:CspA family cold shock protein